MYFIIIGILQNVTPNCLKLHFRDPDFKLLPRKHARNMSHAFGFRFAPPKMWLWLRHCKHCHWYNDVIVKKARKVYFVVATCLRTKNIVKCKVMHMAKKFFILQKCISLYFAVYRGLQKGNSMSIHPEIFENDAIPLEFFFKFGGYIYHLETCKNPDLYLY